MSRNNPSVFHSENAVLSAMIRGGGQIASQICARISADDFSYEAQEVAFRAFQKVIEGGFAPTPAVLREALADALNADVRKDRICIAHSGPAHFAENFVSERFAEPTDCVRNSPLHCDRIANVSLLRKTSEILATATALTELNLAGEAPELNAGEVVASLQSAVLGLSPVLTDKTSVPELLPGFMENLWAEWETPAGTMRGLNTGFKTMDRLTQGFQPGHFVIVSAGTGVGKSALTLNFVLNAAVGHYVKTGQPLGVQVFSHEMSRTELLERMLFSDAQVDINRFHSRELDDNEIQRLKQAAVNISNIAAGIDLHDDRTYTAKRIASIARQANHKGRCRLVVVDYAQIVPAEKMAGRTEMREQQVSAIADTLLSLAGEIKCTVIALSQLNNDNQVRESKRLEQNCHLHAMLSRVDPNEKDKKPTFDSDEPIPHILDIVKARGMKKGKVHLSFHGGQTRFEEKDLGEW